MSWYCQQIGGNETSVGYDDGYVDIEGSDGIVTLAGLYAGRLNGGDTEFLGSLGDRAWTWSTVPSHCCIRTRQDGSYLVTGIGYQGGKRWDGHVRGTSKKKSHTASLPTSQQVGRVDDHA
ncbi:hypothetical protein HMPREF9341_01517 [Cutibacterium acnes HL103PA1]|nr:hypothetical protein HMPREF9341_01517 [Cutibacterium acnes HL103PA1]